MDALDERVLRDDEAAAQLGRVAFDPCARPRRSNSASRPSSPSSESRIDRRPQSCGVPGRPDDRDACGARAMQSAAFEASMPPIATTGTATAAQISRRPSSPVGGSASAFDGVAQTGPAPT